MSTEGTLRDWRYGPIQAERLAAAILELDGFTDVDPQATLGGADDKKDITARRDGDLWIAGVHFPPTEKSFAAIAAKFEDDVDGVERHKAKGFAFFVNKQLTMGERDDLVELAGTTTVLYHLERMRHILDTPKGYGIRLEYLRIGMSVEEQVAFLDNQRRFFAAQLAEVRRDQAGLDELERTAVGLERTISTLTSSLPESSITTPTKTLAERIAGAIPSLEDVGVGDLRLAHRELTDAEPWANGGRFRLVNTWIGSEAHTSYAPPAPEDVETEIEAVLTHWREVYPALKAASEPEILAELARLHHGICAVHPFVDGNGRLARAVLNLAAQDLLGRGISPALTTDHAAYYESLRQADRGKFEPLEELVAGSLVDG